MDDDLAAEYTEPEDNDPATLLRHIARIQQESYREYRKMRMALERIAKMAERVAVAIERRK